MHDKVAAAFAQLVRARVALRRSDLDRSETLSNLAYTQALEAGALSVVLDAQAIQTRVRIIRGDRAGALVAAKVVLMGWEKAGALPAIIEARALVAAATLPQPCTELANARDLAARRQFGLAAYEIADMAREAKCKLAAG